MRGKIQVWINNIIKYIIIFIFGAIILYLTKISLTRTSGTVSGINGISDDNPWLHIAVLLFVIAVCSAARFVPGRINGLKSAEGFIASHGRDGKSGGRICIIAVGVFAAVTLIAMLVWIYITQLLPIGDGKGIVSHALKLYHGDVSPWQKGGFAHMYPNNNGATMYAYYVLVLCGGDYDRLCLGLQYLNVIWMALSILAVYVICRQLFHSQKKALGMYVCTALYLPYVLFISYIYGTVIGMAFALFSILFINKFFNCRKFRYALLSAVCMTIAAIMKMNYLIDLIAVVIMCVLDIFADRRGVLGNIFVAFFIVLCYLVGSRCFDRFVEYKTGCEVGVGLPKIAWLATGLRWQDSDAPGVWDGWSEYNFAVVDYDPEAMEQVVKEQLRVIREKHATSGYTRRFFRAKIQNAWNNPTYDSLGIYKNRDSLRTLPSWVEAFLYGEGQTLYTAVANVVQSLILMGTLLYLLLGVRSIEMHQLIFAIIFTGGFLFHLLWEVTYIYMVCYMVLLVPYAVEGVSMAAGIFSALTIRLIHLRKIR